MPTGSAPGMSAPLQTIKSSTVKHWLQLQSDSKYRYLKRSYLLSGNTLVYEHLSQGLGPVLFAGVSRSFVQERNVSLTLERLECPVYLMEDWQVNRVTGSRSEGIVAEVQMRDEPVDISVGSWDAERFLFLDGIQDPGNMGTILRTALAFGWRQIIAWPPVCDFYHPTVIRASRNAHPNLKLAYLPHDGGNFLPNVPWYISSSRHVRSIDAVQPPCSPCALALGSEARGTARIHDYLASRISPDDIIPINIPISPKIESLNVAVAAGIIMHHFRQ